MKYKNNQQYFFLGIRLGILGLLIWILLKQSTGNFDLTISSPYFFERGFLSNFSYDQSGHAYLDVVKVITRGSMYLLGFLGILLFMSDLSEGYFHVLKAYATSYTHYLQHRFVLFSLFYGRDSLIYLCILLPLTIYFKEVTFLWSIGKMLFSQFLWFLVISYIGKNATIIFSLSILLFLFQKVLVDYFVWSIALALGVLLIVTVFDIGIYLRGEER